MDDFLHDTFQISSEVRSEQEAVLQDKLSSVLVLGLVSTMVFLSVLFHQAFGNKTVPVFTTMLEM